LIAWRFEDNSHATSGSKKIPTTAVMYKNPWGKQDLTFNRPEGVTLDLQKYRRG